MKKTVSVAPMMDCTDRHDRFFLRLISKNVMLYTEMIALKAAIHGDKKIKNNEPSEATESEGKQEENLES